MKFSRGSIPQITGDIISIYRLLELSSVQFSEGLVSGEDALWMRSKKEDSYTTCNNIVCGCSLSTCKKVSSLGGSDRRVSGIFLGLIKTILTIATYYHKLI